MLAEAYKSWIIIWKKIDKKCFSLFSHGDAIIWYTMPIFLNFHFSGCIYFYTALPLRSHRKTFFFSQVKKPALTMMCRLIHGRNLACTQYIALTIFFNCLTWGIIGFSTIKLRNQLPVHLPYFWMLAIGHIQKKIQNLNLFILIAMHLCGCI